MRFVYGIAFQGDDFIMVFHPRRGGWEMPGGKVEEGEDDVDAMKREFREEVGHEFRPIGRLELDDGAVFTGEMGAPQMKGEMDWCAFSQLPEQLSFPKVEYAPLIEWARKQLERRPLDG
jgi:8-oxo-dGTP diphosphatase